MPHPPLLYRHLLWDWNGTLLDDLSLCLGVINTMLEDRDLPVLSRSRYRAVFGFPVIDYYRKAGFDFQQETWEEVSIRFITAYETGRPACRLHSGAHSFLKAFQDCGYTQSILSASKASYLDQAVRDYGLEDFFLGWTGLSDHHARSKVAAGKAHLQDLDLNPGSTLMIGDTLHDAEVAAALEVHCWLVSHGHQSRERLQQSGLPVFSSLQEVKDRLTGG